MGLRRANKEVGLVSPHQTDRADASRGGWGPGGVGPLGFGAATVLLSGAGRLCKLGLRFSFFCNRKREIDIKVIRV